MKLNKKLFVLASTVLLLAACGKAGSSEQPKLDPVDQLIADFKSNNMVVTVKDYAKMEYYDDYSTYTKYLGSYAEWCENSGIFFVPNIGYCRITDDKEVKIDVPAQEKGKLSDVYLMPSTVGDLLDKIGDKAFDEPTDGVYPIKNSDALVYLAVFAGVDYDSALNYTEGSVTIKDGSYEIYVKKDNSADRESWGLTEEDYPDSETTAVISNIGMAIPTELADYAETYVPTGLSNGLSDDEKGIINGYQKDDGLVAAISALPFSTSSYFEDGYSEWHIMDYRIGDITNSVKTIASSNGYIVSFDGATSGEDAQGGQSLIFDKRETVTEESGEVWTKSAARFTYAFVSHAQWMSEQLGYPSWAYPDGRSALAGYKVEYMQPSVCLSNWNGQKDTSGNAIPAYVTDATVDRTTFGEDYGAVTFAVRYDDHDTIIAEGKKYDKILEDAGWTGEGWEDYTDTYSTSTRNSPAAEDGTYTCINVSAYSTELDFTIQVVDPNASYDW